MRQQNQADHQDDQHDGELEEGIQGSGKHLGCCQAQGLSQNYALPEPEPWPVKQPLSVTSWMRHIVSYVVRQQM